MKKIMIIGLLLISIGLNAQNLGVGTTNPSEKLDVNGNINVSGTIKANGVDGTAGQVLMKNGSGNLAWGDVKEFKNLATFRTGASTWTVPAGVTKIFIELWGAGGGGNYYCGGGGGSYLSAIIDVVQGNSISYSVGVGGSGNSDNAATGGGSNIIYSANIYAAGGGTGASYNSGPPGIIGNAFGGQYSTPVGFLNFYGERGRQGQVAQINYIQNGTTVYEVTNGGKGGDAGNSVNSGGSSNTSYYNMNTSTLIRYSNALANANGVGGGGGSGLRPLSLGVSLLGSAGGDGLVIIHY